MRLKKILILTDFSKAALRAVEYGFQIAHQNNAELVFLHFVDDFEDLNLARIKMLEQIKSTGNYATQIRYRLESEKRNLFEGADAHSFSFIYDLMIMGTHGKTDLQQHLQGSHALKIINRSEIPLLVVQKGSELVPLTAIMLPIVDLSLMYEARLTPLLDLASVFAARLQMLLPSYQLENEKAGVKGLFQFLQEEGYTVETIPSKVDQAKLVKAILEQAERQNTSMIAIPAIQGPDKVDFPQKFRKIQQSLITNKLNLPVFCY